jgi:hypothetical protein
LRFIVRRAETMTHFLWDIKHFHIAWMALPHRWLPQR